MTASATSTFPVTIDAPQAPTQFDNLATPNVEHDLLHDWAQDAIKKIEAKLGITSSPDVTSIDYVLGHHQHQGTDRSAQFAAIPIKMVASQVPNPLEVRTSLGVLQSAITPAGEFLDVGATAATLAFRSNVTGDTQDRWLVQADGTMKWGPGGATAPDVTLARISASALKITGSLQLSTPLAVAQGGTGSATQNFVDLTTAQTIAGIKTFSARMIGQGGFDVSGSPSGYTGGELRFPSGAGDAGISTLTTGTQLMNFDHRGTGNSGGWQWRNATTAGSTRMVLTNTGELLLGTTAATGGNTAMTLRGTTGGTQVPMLIWANGTGDGAYDIGLNNTSDGLGTWLIGHEAVGSGKLKFAWETGGGPIDRWTIDTNGNVTLPNAGAALNVASTGGFNGVVLSGTNKRVETRGDISGLAGFDTAGNARYLFGLRSDVTSSVSDLAIYTYSPGRIFFYSGAQLQWGIDNSGNLMSTAGSGGFPIFTGSGVIALRNASANPSSSPVAGGVLYASAGALRWRGSSGTDTQIAAA